MTRRLTPTAAALIAMIMASASPTPGTAQTSPTQVWGRHLCLDSDAGIIGFQKPREFDELTYWRGYASLAKDIVNLWSPPGEVVVYSYPISTFNELSSNAFDRAEISKWLDSDKLVAIVNATQDMHYLGTPVQWSDEIADIIRDAAFGLNETTSPPMEVADIADIALRVNFASGILDRTLANVATNEESTLNFNDIPALSLNPGRDCESATISDNKVYTNLKDAWLGQSNYLATTVPIPGLSAEDRVKFIVSRNIWPEG